MIFKQEDLKRSQIRLPLELHERLVGFAEKNGISMNAALIEILEKTLNDDIALSKLTILESLQNIENLLRSKAIDFDRTSLVASRLVDALKMTNEVIYSKLTVSNVAELLNQKSASLYEDYFSGIHEPTFEDLGILANFFGVNEGWLKHGNLPKFNVRYYRLSLNPVDAVKELLNQDSDGKYVNGLVKPKEILFVRNDSKAGELLIIRKYNDWKVDVFRTPFHISDVIGAGGRTMLKSFYVTLNILYQLYISSNFENSINVRGFIVNDNKFNDISEGIKHPLAVLGRQPSSTWWEDIWDVSMLGKHEYWDGFQSISRDIQEEIDEDDSLSELKSKIRSHELDIIK